MRPEGSIPVEVGIPGQTEIRYFVPGSGKTVWFKDFAEGPEMIVIPAGEFMMGSPESEEERTSREGPLHKVTIAKPFAVGRFAINFVEWDAAVAEGGVTHRPDNPDNEGLGGGRYPVIDVSWEDANAYCAWLSNMTGKAYHLLSEAKWEYCCRAGTATPFWWGSAISTAHANYNGNYTYGNGWEGEYRKRTVPVGWFEPNPWGLYNVHGNVSEWCEDCWHEDYDGAPEDGSAWLSADGGDGNIRVLRGGSWINGPQILRSADRDGSFTDSRDVNYGFRISRTLTP